jgi:hypothetical protein
VFSYTAITHIIEAAPMGGRVEYRCIICFITRATRAEIRQHGFDDHIPQKNVDYRYTFTSAQLLVISTPDED